MVDGPRFRDKVCADMAKRLGITGAAERPALEILRRLERPIRLDGYRERRLVVHDVDGDRRLVGLLGGEVDQRVHVAETDAR
jgi:hypothetical protein